LRALPKGQGNHYVQGLIDQFFLDVEDRIRHVLQPGALGSTPPQNSSFYTKSSTENGKSKRKGRAPERLVTQQMKIFKEQWAGMGLACDLGLVKGDAELAGAMWRNLLGARGARGIAYDPETAPHFRRSVNLMGGEIESKKMKKGGLEAEEAKDDGSGVHDFSPSEVDKYVKYPTLMATLVEYARKEIARLDKLDDTVILQGHLGREFKFSRLPKNVSL
jgi:cytochrome b pre-mRNA-processing protein 3